MIKSDSYEITFWSTARKRGLLNVDGEGDKGHCQLRFMQENSKEKKKSIQPGQWEIHNISTYASMSMTKSGCTSCTAKPMGENYIKHCVRNAPKRETIKNVVKYSMQQMEIFACNVLINWRNF